MKRAIREISVELGFFFTVTLVLYFLLFITGCFENTKEPKSEPEPITTEYSRHDGCVVYKVSKEWQYDVFYTRCSPGETVTTTTRVQNGKTVRPVSVETTDHGMEIK